MDIDERWDDGALLLELHGELDCASAAMLQRALVQARGSEARLITLDLAELTFLDSAGIGALVNAARIAEQHGPPLALLPGPEFLQRRFALLGLDERLPFAKRPDVLKTRADQPATS